MSLIVVQRESGVAVVTLNRPEKLNALNEPLMRELLDAITQLDQDPSVRAGILTGAGGKAFAAGADVSAMAEMTAPDARRFAELGHRVGAALANAHLPFLAAINGVALGGGCELAMCCDILYASDTAKLGQPEVTLGLIPGFGGTQRLARRVGTGRAAELCMTGQVIAAEEALRIGLVDAVMPHDDLLERTRQVAATIAARAPLAVAAIKRAIVRGQDASLATALEIEAASFSSLFGTEDQREGVRAFLEKRPPSFHGK
jgi:enoyl-CoA hydratase